MSRFLFALLFVLGCTGKTEKKTTYVEIPGVPRPLPPGVDPKVPDPINPAPDFISFPAFESLALTDNTTLPEAERVDARYLSLVDKYNEGASASELEAYAYAVAKGLNELSLETDLYYAVPVAGTSNSLWRLDIDEIGLTRAEWRLVEDADPFQLESFTVRGELLKQLTQARRPWINAHNFLNVANNEEVYYEILDVPEVLDDFFFSIGVNIQADFDDVDRDLYLVGLDRSDISIQKNRSLIRLDSRDGIMWGTYDTIVEAAVSDERNLSKNPFPFEARSARVFGHDAQEFIYTLPNGTHGYALFNSLGFRENFAPLNIVQDIGAAGLDPTIRNSLSCKGCHAAGIIDADDRMCDHIIGNSDFTNDDEQIARAFYCKDGLDAAIREDNRKYCDALAAINVDCKDDDPINELVDTFRRTWDLNQVASFFFMREDEFREAVRGSAAVEAEIGQLLDGGKVNVATLIAAKDLIIDEFNLFQDDLGE